MTCAGWWKSTGRMPSCSSTWGTAWTTWPRWKSCIPSAPFWGPLAGCHAVQGARIFYTHGHLYSVKTELGGLLQAARELDANVVLFGHTHQPLCTYREGVHLLNPGSLGYPGEQGRTYGIVDITPQGIACFLATL